MQHRILLRNKLATQVVIRATESFNLHCNNVARQVEEKCCPYYRTLSEKTSIPDLFIREFPSSQNKLSQQQHWYLYLKKQRSHLVTDLRQQQRSPTAHHVNKRSKFLRKLWCCIGGVYYKIIWFHLSTTIAPTKG